MRISDWSSDVCSSDLLRLRDSQPDAANRAQPASGARSIAADRRARVRLVPQFRALARARLAALGWADAGAAGAAPTLVELKRRVSGKSVVARGDRGGRRIIKKKNINNVTN